MTIDEVRAFFEAEGIKRVKLGGFDVDGILRGKYVRPEKFFSAVEKGMGYCDVVFGWDCADQLYDNGRFTGWHTGYPDLESRIDLETMRLIPWEEGVAAFLLDFDPKVCPRMALKRVIARSEEAGFEAKVGFEFEFFLFDATPQELHASGFRDPTPLTPGMFGYSWLRASQQSELVHDLMDGLEAFEIDIEGFHTETGPGVYEAAIGADTPLRAADKAALFKTAVKEICAHHGITASFMAKWSTKFPGCSGHIHQSLWRGETNVFADDGGKQGAHGMSQTMQHFLAGQLQTMPEFCVFYAPNHNSYKRLVPGTWAPTSVTWGHENRTCAARVVSGPGASAMRVEMRLPGSDENPYLALAASLAAGLHGIDQKLVLCPETSGNGYEAEGEPLPRSLAEATEALASSKVAPALLGADLVDHFLRTRWWEVREARKAVTDWELARYFELA